MAVKSKLTDHQWVELEERIVKGETYTSVSKEYNISRRAIYDRLNDKIKEAEKVALQMVVAKQSYDSLPMTSKISATTIMERLLVISENLTHAAEFAAKNTYKFSRLANEMLETIDDSKILESSDTLRMVNGLTSMANEASKLPLGLIQANKEQMQRINEPEAEEIKTLEDFYDRRSHS